MRECDEDRSVYNGHMEVEVVIDRPVGEVWKKYLDNAAWVTTHNIENAHGLPGTLGSIMRSFSVGAKEQGYLPAYYHYCKVIKLVPERHYLLKTYSEKGGSYGLQMTGFDDTRFISMGGKTKVIFNFFGEMKGEAVEKDPDSMNLDESVEGMTKNLNNLKRLLEGG